MEPAPFTVPDPDRLARIMAAEGDPTLFPAPVLELYGQGRTIAAWTRMRAIVRGEAESVRRRLRTKYLDDLRLWSEHLDQPPRMFTLTFVGTKLYGAHQPAADGSCVATLWLVVLLVPVWPLASYVVVEAKTGLLERASWYFLARAPIPPGNAVVRRVVGAVAAAVCGAVALGGLWDLSHVELVAHNAYDEPMWVRVGDRERIVMARSNVRFEDVPVGAVSVSARTTEGDVPVDAAEGALTRGTWVYNIGGRGVLAVYEWVYSEHPRPGEGAEPTLLPDVRLQELHAVDYVFGEAPDTIDVAVGGRAVRRQLADPEGTEAELDELVHVLVEAGRGEQARRVLEAELRVHPANADAAHLLVPLLDPAELAPTWRALLARAPDAVNLHRGWQDLAPDPAAVEAEYLALAQAHPDSAMYAFLAGRASDTGPEAAAWYATATRLDASYPWPWAPLATRLALDGDYAGAEHAYARFAAGLPEHAGEVATERLRCAHARGLGSEDPGVRALLAQSDASGFGVNLALWHAEAHPEQLEDVLAGLDARAVYAGEDRSALAHWRARVALVAGDPARAAVELAKAEAGTRPGLMLALALAGGREPELQALRLEQDSHELTEGERLVTAAWLFRTGRREEADRTAEGLGCAGVLRADVARLPAVEGALAGCTLERRAAGYAAAAVLAEGRAERDEYLRRAYAISLPGELPWLAEAG